jgi:hypothetical protein
VPVGPGTTVYVLHVEPAGMPGFVLDVYGSRAKAAVDAVVLRDEETAVSVRRYRVDAPQVAERFPAGGER